MVRKADDRILIMPGSGVRASNISALIKLTDAPEYHTSASMSITGNMKYTNPAMKEVLSQVMADRQEIESILTALS